MSTTTDPILAPYLDRLADGEDPERVQLAADLAGVGGRLKNARGQRARTSTGTASDLIRDEMRRQAATRGVQLRSTTEETDHDH